MESFLIQMFKENECLWNYNSPLYNKRHITERKVLKTFKERFPEESKFFLQTGKIFFSVLGY